MKTSRDLFPSPSRFLLLSFCFCLAVRKKGLFSSFQSCRSRRFLYPSLSLTLPLSHTFCRLLLRTTLGRLPLSCCFALSVPVPAACYLASVLLISIVRSSAVHRYTESANKGRRWLEFRCGFGIWSRVIIGIETWSLLCIAGNAKRNRFHVSVTLSLLLSKMARFNGEVDRYARFRIADGRTCSFIPRYEILSVATEPQVVCVSVQWRIKVDLMRFGSFWWLEIFILTILVARGSI